MSQKSAPLSVLTISSTSLSSPSPTEATAFVTAAGAKGAV